MARKIHKKHHAKHKHHKDDPDKPASTDHDAEGGAAEMSNAMITGQIDDYGRDSSGKATFIVSKGKDKGVDESMGAFVQLLDFTAQCEIELVTERDSRVSCTVPDRVMRKHRAAHETGRVTFFETN